MNAPRSGNCTFTRLAVASLVLAWCSQTSPAADAETLFATKLLPLLKAKCFACHGDDALKIKGGLDLTSRAKLQAGGDSGAAVASGKSGESLLYKAVLRTDEAVKPMPPKENDKLTDAEVRAVKDWIDGGAPWPSEARIAELVRAAKPVGIVWPTSGGLNKDWTERTYKPEDLWAYRPLVRPPVPVGAMNPIDAFVNAKVAAPAADRRTLIRRVTFDLTGLPPDVADVDAFLKDPATEAAAFEKVIDRLMASPHYGEQMARHWLDVVRYADSAGFANDYERGSAWRYRDFVVRSFNADLPYDRFLTHQVAGDELDAGDAEKLVAVGFLRMGAWELTGMEVPKIARQRYLDDVTDTVGQVFLGHMLQCARCHDHKFDPVPTRDYYRIQAAFATTQIVERPAAFLPAERRDGFEERKYLDARKAHFQSELKRIQKLEGEARAKWLEAHPDRKGEKPPRHEFLSAQDLGLERIARKGLERLAWEYDRFEPVAHSVFSGATPNVKSILTPFRLPNDPRAGTVEASHILTGGDPFSPAAAVTPGILSAAAPGMIPITTDGRRTALAAWMTDPKNPLTARVMANRIWQWTMGTPLAGNPNNFGATGKKPTHPELLDWLAAEFIARKYSVKQLQRLILTSEAYRYAVRKPRRLAAEELRDAILAATGELNRAVGGIPVRPEMNPDVALQPRQVMGTFAPAWEPSPKPEQRHRRTLYTLKLRGIRDPMLEVFNAPAPESSCEARELSTVAPQAFALFNGESMRQRALALALRVLKDSPKPEDAVRAVYRHAITREPTAAELVLCLKHWADMTQRHRTIAIAKPKVLTEVTREAVEENTGVKFTFVEPLYAAKDFVPDAHPADATAEVRGLMELCLVIFNTNEFLNLD